MSGPCDEPLLERVEERRAVGDRDDQRPRPVLGLSEQVERERRGIGVAGGDHEQVARPGEAVDADLSEHLPLGLLHVQVPGPTITSTRRSISVPYASAATAWAPPIRYTASAPASRQAASTTGSSSPSRRAASTPRSADAGELAPEPCPSRPCSGTGRGRQERRRRRCRPELPEDDPVTAELDHDRRSGRRPRDTARRSRSRARSRGEPAGSSAARRVESPSVTSSGSGSRRRCRTCGCSRASPRRRQCGRSR